jgi:hypothetical protein
MQSAVLAESVEFSYQYFRQVDIPNVSFGESFIPNTPFT